MILGRKYERSSIEDCSAAAPGTPPCDPGHPILSLLRHDSRHQSTHILRHRSLLADCVRPPIFWGYAPPSFLSSGTLSSAGSRAIGPACFIHSHSTRPLVFDCIMPTTLGPQDRVRGCERSLGCDAAKLCNIIGAGPERQQGLAQEPSGIASWCD